MEHEWDKYRDKIIGLGEHSLRKSYYPELQKKIDELENNQNNLQTIINSINDAIIIHDKNGCILSLNKSAGKIYNIPVENATQYTIFDITSPNQESVELGEIWEKVSNNTPMVFEWLGLQVETNKEIPLQVSLSPTLWNRQNAIVAVVRDFTKRKKYEAELIKAKEKAEQANKLKSLFLQNMSHEVRTPMNGIIGFANMLNEADISPEKQLYYSKVIQESSYQLLKIIDDILEITTLDSKQTKTNIEDICLNDLLSDLLSNYNTKATVKNIPIHLKTELDREQSLIRSDKFKLTKIISNLLDNALKFTKTGYVEFGYAKKGENIILYVKDTGIGISPSNIKNIFDRFSQEEKELSRNYGGLGLGLSISRENAYLLGGDITLKSEKGKGSVFYLTIPYKPVNNMQIKETLASSNKNIKKDKAYRILVAEDEEINYLYLKDLLETLPRITVIHANNGKEAIDICLSDKNIDLVLMDIKMPEIDGHTATKEIKAVLPELPIVAQTAFSTEAEKNLAISYGFDDFISKPLNKEKLFMIIKKLVIDS